MQTSQKNGPEGQGEAAPAAGKNGRAAQAAPWYAGPYQDALLYLMVAIFFVELVVGGIAFFYGVMHAAPDLPGGPPMARFPWLGWAVAAILAPVGLLLVLHVSGSFVARFLGREDTGRSGHAAVGDGEEQVPERLRRFYAIIRSAPTVVLLLGIMLLGAALFFVDGAFSALMRLGGALTAYIPWIAGSVAAVVMVCYLAHRWFVYRHHRMREEYAYRREVLERTGIVLVDKGCVPLPRSGEQALALNGAQASGVRALPQVLEAEGRTPDKSAPEGADSPDRPEGPEDVTDAELVSPEEAANSCQRPGGA